MTGLTVKQPLTILGHSVVPPLQKFIQTEIVGNHRGMGRVTRFSPQFLSLSTACYMQFCLKEALEYLGLGRGGTPSMQTVTTCWLRHFRSSMLREEHPHPYNHPQNLNTPIDSPE